MKTISVIAAKHAGNHKLEIVFANNKRRVVDFEQFLQNHNHPQFNKYKKQANFKRFKIENGNIVWGKDWDMIFPVWNLYNGKIE